MLSLDITEPPGAAADMVIVAVSERDGVVRLLLRRLELLLEVLREIDLRTIVFRAAREDAKVEEQPLAVLENDLARVPVPDRVEGDFVHEASAVPLRGQPASSLYHTGEP